MKKVISEFNERFEKDIINLANKRFGEDYFSKEQLDEYLSDNNTIIKLCILDGSVVGYCIFIKDSIENVSKKMKVSKKFIMDVSEVDKSDEVVYITKSMAVEKEFCNYNIGATIFKACLDEALKKGIKSAWCSAWKYNDKIPVKGILESNGFTNYKEVTGLWFKDKKYKCVICNGPCKCKAQIYYKKLK